MASNFDEPLILQAYSGNKDESHLFTYPLTLGKVTCL